MEKVSIVNHRRLRSRRWLRRTAVGGRVERRSRAGRVACVSSPAPQVNDYSPAVAELLWATVPDIDDPSSFAPPLPSRPWARAAKSATRMTIMEGVQRGSPWRRERIELRRTMRACDVLAVEAAATTRVCCKADMGPHCVDGAGLASVHATATTRSVSVPSPSNNSLQTITTVPGARHDCHAEQLRV